MKAVVITGYKQTGAALVVGLIVLLVMTMMGISSMGGMITQLKISNNIQNQKVAFQVAASAAEQVLLDPAMNWNDNANGVIGASIATQPTTYTAPTGETAESVINYGGCRKVFMGSSLTSGSMAALSHEIIVTGEAKNANGDVIGTSRQVIGVQTVMVASC